MGRSLRPGIDSDSGSRTGRVQNAIPNRVINAWQSLYDFPITEEDAREIVENITGFFGTLIEWERKARIDRKKIEEGTQ